MSSPCFCVKFLPPLSLSIFSETPRSVIYTHAFQYISCHSFLNPLQSGFFIETALDLCTTDLTSLLSHLIVKLCPSRAPPTYLQLAMNLMTLSSLKFFLHLPTAFASIFLLLLCCSSFSSRPLNFGAAQGSVLVSLFFYIFTHLASWF